MGEEGEQLGLPLDRFDLVVYGIILIVGALQVLLYQRAHDFLADDVFYFEGARSLIQHGFYGFNGRTETNQPPGLPALLALMCLARAGTHAAFLRAMAVFETLGFVASYALLRRHVPRAVAAAICLLLISSPIYFDLATQWVFPSFPFFFTTISGLLTANRLENARHTSAKITWGALLALLIVASLMLASAAMALLGAIVAVIGVTSFRDRRLAVARLKNLFVPLMLGITVEGYWMHRKPMPLEWPLPGYPLPYLEQLKVKSGNHPELGMATLGDVAIRIVNNGIAHSALLAQLLFRHWVNVNWVSVLILGPILLILLGWGYSIWRTGGELHDWYFAGYEFIYLLWPWSLETRFFLPAAPLACMYLWRGVKVIGVFASHKPRMLGVVWLPVGAFLTASAWLWERGGWLGQNALTHGGLQDEVSVALWLLSATTAGWMAWTGSSPPLWSVVRRLSQWSSRPISSLRVKPLRWLQVFAGIALASLLAIGLGMQLQDGRDNFYFQRDNPSPPPDVAAAMWVHSNTDSSAIVMARQVPITYYYADRKMIWFPPSSDPQLLMDGISRHRIDYVIVTQRKVSYYLPSDDDCFASVLATYPEAFRLASEAPGFRIFQVVRNTAPPPGLSDRAQQYERPSPF